MYFVIHGLSYKAKQVVDGLGSINDSIRVFEAHPTFISFDLLATGLKNVAFLIGFYLEK